MTCSGCDQRAKVGDKTPGGEGGGGMTAEALKRVSFCHKDGNGRVIPLKRLNVAPVLRVRAECIRPPTAKRVIIMHEDIRREDQAHTQRSSVLRSRITTNKLLILSYLLHVALLLYADHVDRHPERYGGLKYTDVDWRVVSDGAALIFRGEKGGTKAQGWLTKFMGWDVGE